MMKKSVESNESASQALARALHQFLSRSLTLRQKVITRIDLFPSPQLFNPNRMLMQERRNMHRAMNPLKVLEMSFNE